MNNVRTMRKTKDFLKMPPPGAVLLCVPLAIRMLRRKSVGRGSRGNRIISGIGHYESVSKPSLFAENFIKDKKIILAAILETLKETNYGFIR